MCVYIYNNTHTHTECEERKISISISCNLIFFLNGNFFFYEHIIMRQMKFSHFSTKLETFGKNLFQAMYAYSEKPTAIPLQQDLT